LGKYNVIKDFKIDIPKQVRMIIGILEQNGYEAFAVGGCVRDTILNRRPQDWDITTSALPHQVKELFNRTIDTGIQHGTVTVMLSRVGYEVTTYRIDGEYNDSRHPDTVEFTSDLIEDLKRRDFTINAMAYNPRMGLVDAFDGIGDIEKKIIRCVGNAQERFNEDALRILRAVRFSAQLGFDIEENTKNAIKKLAPTLKNISAERIHVELEKLIMSPHPGKLSDAYYLGITKVILPEFDRIMECPQNTPYHMYNVGEHTIKVMENTPATKEMRWAALLHDIGKPDALSYDKNQPERMHFYGHDRISAEMVAPILRRLKLDNKTIKLVTRLVEHHDDRPGNSKKPVDVRRSVHIIGKDIYQMYLQLAYADFQGKSDYGKNKGYDGYLYTKEQFKYIMDNNICTSKSEMAISGRDLIEAGCPRGEIIGDILNKLLDMVIENPDLNKKEKLSDIAKTMF
jgi:tRNA nucleotidyltransferase (CCA-adding enzyme)